MSRQLLLIALSILATAWGDSLVSAQSDDKKVRKLSLKAKSPPPELAGFHLFSREPEQEQGNAVPVLLRLPHEQTTFMATQFNKLHEYSDLAVGDPKLDEIQFGHFAKQIVRAGNMSFADWQYPIRSNRQPYMILLPDVQAQRVWIARGMTVWIKQQLSKGETATALEGIRAQLGCSRHISQTPFAVCNLVGTAIAIVGLENIELAMEHDKTPNLYWSLAALPNTLVDIGPMVRWENQMMLQSLPSLTNPLPAIGDSKWKSISDEFITMMTEINESRYTEEEAQVVMANIDQLAKKLLTEEVGFTAQEMETTTIQERIMRWILIQHSRRAAATESMIQLPLELAISVKEKLDAQHELILKQTKAKSSFLPAVLDNAFLSSHRFGRHVRLLQTIESIRDYVAKHDGKLPSSLADLELPAPNDPFTNKPFLYSPNGKTATLKWAEVPVVKLPEREYHLELN